MLTCGAGKAADCLPLLRLKDDEIAALAAALKTSVNQVRVGKTAFVPLPVAHGARIGQVNEKYYDAAKNTWAAAIAVSRVQ